MDDGVKLDVDALNGNHIGDSFRPDKAAFFAGPCIHGTDMARFISKVCPRVKLYMARLDDSRKEENQTFTTQSACEVSKSLTMTLVIRSLRVMIELTSSPGLGMGGENGGRHCLHELEL